MVYSFVNIFKAEVQEASGGGPTGERAKSWYMLTKSNYML